MFFAAFLARAPPAAVTLRANACVYTVHVYTIFAVLFIKPAATAAVEIMFYILYFKSQPARGAGSAEIQFSLLDHPLFIFRFFLCAHVNVCLYTARQRYYSARVRLD